MKTSMLSTFDWQIGHNLLLSTIFIEQGLQKGPFPHGKSCTKESSEKHIIQKGVSKLKKHYPLENRLEYSKILHDL